MNRDNRVELSGAARDNRKNLQDALRVLPRTEHTDPRYPIDAYEDDLVALINQQVRAALEEVKSYAYEQRVRSDESSLGSHIRVVRESAINTVLNNYPVGREAK